MRPGCSGFSQGGFPCAGTWMTRGVIVSLCSPQPPWSCCCCSRWRRRPHHPRTTIGPPPSRFPRSPPRSTARRSRRRSSDSTRRSRSAAASSPRSGTGSTSRPTAPSCSTPPARGSHPWCACTSWARARSRSSYAPPPRLEEQPASGFETTRGASYLVLVGKKPKTADAAFKLSAELVLPPANDSASQAKKLGKLPASAKGSTLGATSADNDPDGCRLSGNTVWYSVAPAGAERMIVRLQTAGGFDAVVAVVERSHSDSNVVGCVATNAGGGAVLPVR